MTTLKPKIYFTSDWHVGHQTSLKFDKRPFRDLDHMHESLIKNFNRLVPEHGITYFLGDMGLCSSDLLGSVIRQLNGKLIMVPGNHDSKGMYAYYDMGFDFVTYKAQIHIGDNIVTMSHCPLKGVFREDITGMKGVPVGSTDNWHNESVHKDKYSIEDFGQFHLHGHIHSPNDGKSTKILGRQMDIGVCGNSYEPVSISQVESWIAKTKNDEKNK